MTTDTSFGRAANNASFCSRVSTAQGVNRSLDRSRTGSTARRSSQRNSLGRGSASPGVGEEKRISVMSNQREIILGPTFRAAHELENGLQVHGESQLMLGGANTSASQLGGADRSFGSGILSSTKYNNVSFPDQAPGTVTLNPHRVNHSGFESEPFQFHFGHNDSSASFSINHQVQSRDDSRKRVAVRVPPVRQVDEVPSRSRKSSVEVGSGA